VEMKKTIERKREMSLTPLIIRGGEMKAMDMSQGARITLPRSTGKNRQKSLSTAIGGEVRAQRRLANDNSWRQAA
jgi:hypothetical protein